MRSFLLTFAMYALASSELYGDPPVKVDFVEVRPVMWWSDVGRISDGGGPILHAHTYVVAESDGLAKLWRDHKLTGQTPQFNFKDFIVVVTFRESGLDFREGGGLMLNRRGGASLFGAAAHKIATNACWYSTTIGVFPREGIASVNGEYLPQMK